MTQDILTKVTTTTSAVQYTTKTATAWASANPILGVAEIALESDSHKIKIGDGVTSWTSLGYVTNAADLAAVWGSVTGTLSNQTDLNSALAAKAPVASPVFTGTIGVPVYTLTTLPSATTANKVIVVSNANTGAGTVAFSNGTNWIDVRTGVAVA